MVGLGKEQKLYTEKVRHHEIVFTGSRFNKSAIRPSGNESIQNHPSLYLTIQEVYP